VLIIANVQNSILLDLPLKSIILLKGTKNHAGIFFSSSTNK